MENNCENNQNEINYTSRIKLASLNINCIKGRVQQQKFYFKAHEAIKNLIKNNYIVCIQEPKFCKEVAYLISIFMRAHTTLQGHGLITFIPSNAQIINKQVMLGGRLHSTTLVIHKRKYTIINLYAPTKGNQNEKAEFFKKVEDSLEEIKEANVNSQLFMCGDLNIDLDEISLPNKALCRIMNKFNLKDAFKYRHPNSKGYTRIPSQFQWGEPTRMDAFFIPQEYSRLKFRSTHVTDSDHRLCTISINELDESKWKSANKKPFFNKALLNDPESSTSINQIIQNHKNLEDPEENFQNLTGKIMNLSKKIAKEKIEPHDVEINKLNKKISKAESNYDKLSPTQKKIPYKH